MLDFYLIQDEQSKPDFPAQVGLEFAGSLDDKTFQNLQNKGIIDRRFDFYSHFRLGTGLIKQIRNVIFKEKLENDNDVKKLLELFDSADLKRCGLIAYGD